MDKTLAETLAATMGEGDYRARRIRGHWVVWSDASDHMVEFDQRAIEYALRIAKELDNN
jgi:electron transfer flavoprotein alpha/beta subunit